MSDGVTPTGALEIVSCVMFLVGLKLMGKQATAKLGNAVSAAAMLLAVVVALLATGVAFAVISVTVVIGALIGGFAAVRVKMTAMPELVALFNGSGGLASLAVGLIELLPDREVALTSRITASAAVIMPRT